MDNPAEKLETKTCLYDFAGYLMRKGLETERKRATESSNEEQVPKTCVPNWVQLLICCKPTSTVNKTNQN
jgi:hypothetical protein